MKILGISAFYHDSAACIVVDGDIIAAASEERFTRKKFDSNFPENSIKFCLAYAGINPLEIDYVVFYEKPFLKFERLLETYLAYAPKGFKSFNKSMPIWLKDKIFQKSIISSLLNNMFQGSKSYWEEKLLFSEHHLSHAASAFFPSPFDRAAILTMDGMGEWATTTLSIGNGNNLTIKKEIQFPHSIGMLYSAFTYYLGFKVNSGEYKVMGLAPYGVAQYANKIRENLIDIKDDGSFRLDLSYFDFCTGLTMTNDKFNELFEGPPRRPETFLRQQDMDLAASVQLILDEIVLKICKNLSTTTNEKNLCLAGGVALNCVTNSKILKSGYFDQIWIQPAAGDAGGAIGAALSVYYLALGHHRTPSLEVDAPQDNMKGSFLGPEFNQNQISYQLENCGAIFETVDDDKLFNQTVSALADGKAVGWFSGRMEFGPRALGNRSILADPRSPKIQKLLNLKIKFRESFRPFAPSVLANDALEWFDIDVESPYMLLVANVQSSKRKKLSQEEEKLFGIEKLNIPRSSIPAVTHVDYSARIQTVHHSTNPRYYNLLLKFKEKTGCPILVNTSFNIRGEPIVCSPKDAFNCFMGTDLDVLVIGNAILYKHLQTAASTNEYQKLYELD